MQRKLGIIAFTDIPGYSELMKNNDVGEQLESVLKLIYEIPDRISPFIITLFDGKA